MSTSYMVIEKVRRAISTAYVTASDTDVAKALDVSRTAVSSYKHGRDVMSMETLERAQALMQLDAPELAEIAVTLASEQSPSARAIHAAHRWMLEAAKRASVVILAALAFAGAPAPSEAYTGSRALVSTDDLYIMRSGNRRRRQRFAGWLRALSRFFKVAVTADCLVVSHSA